MQTRGALVLVGAMKSRGQAKQTKLEEPADADLQNFGIACQLIRMDRALTQQKLAEMRLVLGSGGKSVPPVLG